ncbi:PAS domain-containing protein, partial [Escherichia coli]|uniref:PAS domain-containing protein n=1 Tax=Escherichia coli TaxID=562 RepID=UPI0039DF981B
LALLPDALAVVGDDGRCLAASPAFASLFGRDPAQLSGRPLPAGRSFHLVPFSPDGRQRWHLARPPAPSWDNEPAALLR